MNAIAPLDDLAPYEMAGPTLLAQQPPTTSKPKQAQKEWQRIYDHLEGRMNGLRMWRYSRWIYWADIAKYLIPYRYIWLVTANRMARDRPINNAIIDNTGTQAMWTCASGLWTGLTSPTRPWFKLGVDPMMGELDRDARLWLEDTQGKLYAVLAASNFYTTTAQMFQDVTSFGSSPMIVYEDLEDIIRCYLPCAGEYYLDVGSRLKIDTLYREFTLNVIQIVDMFGLENCPADVAKMWEEGGGSWEREFVIAHAIEPNAPLSSTSKFKAKVQVAPSAFPFREVYWVRGQSDGGALSIRGFNEAPFACARWKTVSNDPYGRSLAEDALGDIKQLQLETMRKAEFIEKLVRPPMGANVEMKNEPSSIIPGHVTYTDTSNGKKGFWPLIEVQPQALSPMVEDIKQIQERVKACFFVPIFMAITQMQGVQPRNELELTKRDQERLQALGPFIELFETEFADPVIRRVLAIMDRRGMLAPKPPSLQRTPLKIDYVSVLALAQRSSETVTMKDVLGVGAQLTEAAQAAGSEAPLRIMDLDAAFRKYAALATIDPALLKPENQVKREDAAKAQQRQAQAAMQAAPVAADAAKNLAQAPMGGNTALSALLGNGGNVPQPGATPGA